MGGRPSGRPLAATNVETAGSVCKRHDAVYLGRKEGLQPRASERPAVACSAELARVAAKCALSFIQSGRSFVNKSSLPWRAPYTWWHVRLRSWIIAGCGHLAAIALALYRLQRPLHHFVHEPQWKIFGPSVLLTFGVIFLVILFDTNLVSSVAHPFAAAGSAAATLTLVIWVTTYIMGWIAVLVLLLLFGRHG